MFTRSSSFFSSSWERKAPAAFFHKGGEANPFGGWAAGLRVAKSLRSPAPAMQIRREQSSPSPMRGLAAPGGPGQDAGAALPEGVHLVPKRTPKSGPRKAAPAPSLLTPLFGFLAPVPFGEGTCFDLPIFPPVHLWQRGLASRQRPPATCGVEARTGRVQRSLGNTDPKLLGLSGRLRVQSA